VTDTPGAFLYADMKETVHMVSEGMLAKPIIKLEPTIYRIYIWHDKIGAHVVCAVEEGIVWYATKRRYFFGTYYPIH